MRYGSWRRPAAGRGQQAGPRNWFWWRGFTAAAAQGALGCCWHVWSVVRVPAQSAAAGACVNTVHGSLAPPPWPHLTSPATSDHQPRPGKPRKLVLSPTAGVRRETSYGETAGRAAAPCSVSSVHSPRHTGPSRAAASESPSPPQQHGTGSRDKGRLPQLDTVVTECQHSVLTPDTD